MKNIKCQTVSETELNYYQQKVNVQAVSRVAKRLKAWNTWI